MMAAEKTNVLLIIADDMGVDAINGYGVGTDLPLTPHIDSLRASGVTFTNTWATPVCAATRASLITGKYGVNNEVNTLPGNLKPKHKTIFTEISELDSEYSTSLIGKWHLAKAKNPNHPISHGVGEYMGVLGNGVDDYYNWLKVEDGVEDTCKEYVTSYLTDYAIDWIKEQSSPWFMWLAHVSPHSPYHDVPDHMATSAGSGPAGQYKRMIESLDYEVGRMFDSIPADVWANTVVLFLGDNGTPGNVLQGFPDKRGKQTLYQGGINVPFVVSGAGVTRQGEVEDALVNVSDFYVTIAQMIKGDAFPDNTAFDGVSFKHLLDGTAGEERSVNYMELGANATIPDDIYTVATAQYKLIDLGNNNLEMYDLVEDAMEEDDLMTRSLTVEQELAKSELVVMMDFIRGFSNVITPEDTTSTAPVGSATKYPVVHTGVTEFYDENSLITTPDMSDDFYWQDAGRVMNQPSYTDNDNGTVTDDITGLMWQQDMGEKMTYAEALVAISDFNLGGYDDWRLPTIKELYSLILFSGRVFGETAQTNFIDSDYFDQPWGDTDIGEREIDAQTWSSTHYTSVTMNSDTTIFGVNFVDGRIKGYPKYLKRTGEANAMYFRFVRGNEDYGSNLFYDNNNGTVTDSATLLMWQQADDGVARDWPEAISYCEALALGGHDDWHLPNAKELHTILDYSRSPDATNSAAIDPVFSTTSINDAEGNAGHYPYFWTTSPHKDGPNQYSSAVYIAFGEAKGEMNGTLMDVHGAGAQRSDPKTGATTDYPKYFGPQGDVQRVYNHCRCVRSVDDNISAIDDNNEVLSNVEVFPNPTDGIVTLVFPEDAGTATVAVYDVMGKRLLSTELQSSMSTIDMSSFGAGVYHLVLTSGDVQVVRSLMKR